jgi:hypothetical protein
VDYDWEDEIEEARRPIPFRCSDGFCGQLDCHRCYPNQIEERYDDGDDL